MPSYDYTDPQGKSFTLDVDEELSPEQVYQRFAAAGIAPRQQTQSNRETPGYLSQLGGALGLGYRQMKSGLGATFNAATGDVQDTAAAMAEMGALQREQEATQTPEDIAFNEELARNEAEYDAARGLWDSTKALSGYVGSTLAHPGAAFKQVVQSAPNALVGGATELAGAAIGGLIGGGAGLEMGPGAIATGIAGAMAGGAASNTLLEAGPAIYDILNERTNGAAASMTADQIAQILRQNPDIMSEGLKTGAIRGSVIGAIEGLGMKGAGRLLTIPERAAARAMQNTLIDAGVNVASKEAVEKALLDPALKAAATTAAETAKKQFTSAGNLARFAGGAAIETGSAGAGELGAQVATGQKVSPTGIFQEMLGEAGMSLPMAGATKAWEARKYLVPQAAQNQLESSVEGVINNADVAPLTAQVLANESPDATPAGGPVPGDTETEEILPGIGAINRADLAGIPPAEPLAANEPPSPESLVGDAGEVISAPVESSAYQAAMQAKEQREETGGLTGQWKPVASDEPPVPTGFVRFYHAGSQADKGERRWLSPDRTWVANFRPGHPVFFVDIPLNDPQLKKSWDDSGTPNSSRFVNFEADEETSSRLSPIPTTEESSLVEPQKSSQTTTEMPVSGKSTVTSPSEALFSPQPQTTQTNALQKQSTGSVLQREQKEARKTGSERERVEPSLEGQEAAGARQEGEKVAILREIRDLGALPEAKAKSTLKDQATLNRMLSVLPPTTGNPVQHVLKTAKRFHENRNEAETELPPTFHKTNEGVEAKIGGKVVGEASNVSADAETAKRLFPQVQGEVRRIQGIQLEPKQRGRGFGKQLYAATMSEHPDAWYYNSQASKEAARALRSMERYGLIELHVKQEKDGEFGPHIKRLTPAGKAFAKQITPQGKPTTATEGKVTPGGVATFKTAKGSEYILYSDGTTIRNKAERPEHPGEKGIMPQSSKTIFVTKEGADALGIVQTEGIGFELKQRPDKTWGAVATDGPAKGKFYGTSITQASESPEVGLIPVEIWNRKGKKQAVHFGNEITEITPQGKPTTDYNALTDEERAMLNDTRDENDLSDKEYSAKKRGQNKIKRSAKTNKFKEFLKGQGVDVTNLDVNTHITSIDTQNDGSFQIRLEHHTKDAYTPEMVRVRSGDSLSNPGKLSFVNGLGTVVTYSDGTVVDSITGEQITPLGKPTTATEGPSMPGGVGTNLMKPYAAISVPDLEKLPESDWSKRRAYLQGKFQNAQRDKDNLNKTPKNQWGDYEYNENATINAIFSSVRAAIQDMQLARPDLEKKYFAKSQSNENEETVQANLGRDGGKPKQQSATLPSVSGQQPKTVQASGQPQADKSPSIRSAGGNVLATKRVSVEDLKQQARDIVKAQFGEGETGLKDALSVFDGRVSAKDFIADDIPALTDSVLEEWRVPKAQRDAIYKQLTKRVESYYAQEEVQEEQITPLGKPTTATEGPSMPGGSGELRDKTKPEQMTPEELAAFRTNESIKIAQDALDRVKSGKEAPNIFTNGFKSKAAMIRAREADLEKAKSTPAKADVWETVTQAADNKLPISAQLVDSLSDKDTVFSIGPAGEPGGTSPSLRKQLIENLSNKGYVKQGDLYIFKPGATGKPVQAAPSVAQVETKPTAPGPVTKGRIIKHWVNKAVPGKPGRYTSEAETIDYDALPTPSQPLWIKGNQITQLFPRVNEAANMAASVDQAFHEAIAFGGKGTERKSLPGQPGEPQILVGEKPKSRKAKSPSFTLALVKKVNIGDTIQAPISDYANRSIVIEDEDGNMRALGMGSRSGSGGMVALGDINNHPLLWGKPIPEGTRRVYTFDWDSVHGNSLGIYDVGAPASKSLPQTKPAAKTETAPTSGISMPKIIPTEQFDKSPLASEERKNAVISYAKALLGKFPALADVQVVSPNSEDELVRLVDSIHGRQDEDVRDGVYEGEWIPEKRLIIIPANAIPSHIAHEVGHAVIDEYWFKADAATKKAVQAEHAAWAKKSWGKPTVADSLRAWELWKADKFPDLGAIREHPKGISAEEKKKVEDYRTSFLEWAADQFSYWSQTKEQPKSLVDKFFADLSAKLASIWDAVKQHFAPNATFSNWVESLLQTTASETQTPTPSRKGVGASGVAQAKPAEGSIPADKTKETPYKEESRGKVEGESIDKKADRIISAADKAAMGSTATAYSTATEQEETVATPGATESHLIAILTRETGNDGALIKEIASQLGVKIPTIKAIAKDIYETANRAKAQKALIRQEYQEAITGHSFVVNDKVTWRDEKDREQFGVIRGIKDGLAVVVPGDKSKSPHLTVEVGILRLDTREALASRQRAIGETVRSISGPGDVEWNGVSVNDGLEALSRMHNSGEFPGLLNAFVGTTQQFVEKERNNPNPEYQALVALIERGKPQSVAEGYFMETDGRSIQFTDRTGITPLDRRLAEFHRVPVAVAASMRVLSHEGLGHRGWWGLNDQERAKLTSLVKAIKTPEDFDLLAKQYPAFADWRENADHESLLVQEFISKIVESLRTLPKSGPVRRLLEYLQELWQKFFGKPPRTLTLKEFRLFVEMLQAGAKAPKFELVNGGKINLRESRPTYANPIDAQLASAAERMRAMREREKAPEVPKALARLFDVNAQPTGTANKLFQTAETQREEEVTPLDNIKRIVSENVSRAEVESLLKDLNTEEIKEVVRSIGYPTQGTKADNIRRILSFVGSRADAIAIRGINPINLNAPTIVRTPEQQAAFDEQRRIENERAKELDIHIPQKKPTYDQEAWNRSMAAIRAPSSVSPQAIRNEIRSAYDRASTKAADIWVSLDQLYDEVKATMPTLTEREFGEQVQNYYEDGSAVLQNTLASNAEMIAQGEKYGVYFNTGLGSAAPASSVLLMPETIKASRVVNTAIHSARGMGSKVNELVEELPANTYTGKPLQDAIAQSFAPLSSRQFFDDSKGLIVKSIDDMVKRGVDEGEVLEAVLDPAFIEQTFKGWNESAQAVAQMLFFAEGLRRAVKKQSELFAAKDIAGYNLLQQKIDRWSKFYYSRGNVYAAIGNAMQHIMDDPDYQGLLLLTNFASQKVKQEQEVTDSSMKNPVEAAKEIDKAGKDSAEDATQAASDQVMQAVIDDEIAAGEAALTPENRTLWEETKRYLRTLARLTSARLKILAKGIKASNAAESADVEEARYVQMSLEEVDKLIAQTQAKINKNLKKLTGAEDGKPRTPKEEAVDRMVKRYTSKEKRSTVKDLLSQDEQKALKALIRKLNQARPGETAPFSRAASWKRLFEMTPRDQGMMKGRMFDIIKSDPAFENLSSEDQQKLATLLEKSWDKRREQFLTRELERIQRLQNMSKKAAKALQQRSAILRKIDSGVFDYEDLAALVGEQYGIKNLTPAETQRVKEISSQLGEDLFPHQRQKLQDELQELMVIKHLSLGEMLKAWWITAVLSGPRTAFTIGLSFMTGGFELLGHSISVLVNPKSGLTMDQRMAAISDSIKNWWSSLTREAKTAWMFVLTGDKTIQDPDSLNSQQFFAEQARGNLGRYSFPAAEKMIASKNPAIRGAGYFMRYSGRILAALDTFNYGITKAGSAPLVYAMLNNAYTPGAMSTSKLFREAKQEIIDREYGGVAPPDSVQLDAWARNLAYAKLDKLTGMAENMNQVAKQGNFTIEPTGLGGWLYNVLQLADGFLQKKAEKFVTDMKKDVLRGNNYWADRAMLNLATLVQAGVMQTLPILGLSFARFAANSLNQTISFMPVLGLIRRKEKVSGQQAHEAMVLRNNAIGTLAFVWVYVTLKAIEQEPDDEKRGWGIEGDWSNLTPQEKRQRDATGLKENTLWWRDKNGKRVVLNFVNWPVRPILAAFGALSDQIKYSPDQWAEGGVLKRGVAAGWAMAKSVSASSAVSQFTELFGSSIASRDPVEAFTNKAARVFGGYAGGFVPRVIKDLDRWMQPEINKYEGWEYLGKELPFYRRTIGKEYLDVFGKPIAPSQAIWSREMVQQPMEPEYQLLGRLNSRGMWLTPAVAENRLVGKGSRKRPMTDAEAQKYVKEVGKGYREMILRYGDRLLTMPKDRAKDFLAARADDVRERSVKLAIRP